MSLAVQFLVLRDFGLENDLYIETRSQFANQKFISPALIQRIMKVSYIRARYVLDRLIQDKFCTEQVGSMPCRVIANEKN